MDRELMALGAFVFVLGVAMIVAVPILVSLQSISQSALIWVSDPIDMVWVGMVIAPLGAAILAFGLGSRDLGEDADTKNDSE